MDTISGYTFNKLALKYSKIGFFYGIFQKSTNQDNTPMSIIDHYRVQCL